MVRQQLEMGNKCLGYNLKRSEKTVFFENFKELWSPKS
jgi:hypothetical protein